MSDKTTIAISRGTKALLDKIGKKGDTYDSILQRVLEEFEKLKNAIQKHRG